MKKKTIPTRNGNDMFVISSLIQKALRRRDPLAYYAANELLPHYRNYMWKRLLTVSAEDCYDMITHRIWELHQKDNEAEPTERKYVAMAVSTLMNARKNRDGDYIACNILNSRDTKDITKYVPEPQKDDTCATKNGHCMFDLAIVFRKALLAQDDIMVGYAINELRVYYRKFTWKLLIQQAQELRMRDVEIEIRALREADKLAKEQSTIFLSKAIAILLKVVKYEGTSIFLKDFIYNDKIDLHYYDDKKYRVPDYVFDCHTYIGKAKGMTKRQFVVAEQEALCPHKEGEYDHASWEHFFWLCDNGFFTDEYTPYPSKERRKELESGAVQLNLFGE